MWLILRLECFRARCLSAWGNMAGRPHGGPVAFHNLVRDPPSCHSVHRLEIAICSVQSRLLSLSSPPAAPALPTVAQALHVSVWTSAVAGYDLLYSAEVAAQLCREHGLEPSVHSVTTFAEFIMSVRARTWSLVVNFQDSKGQQVSKSAHHSRQTSCLHGLWFGLVHQPPAWDSDDHAYISSIGSAREQLGDGLCPMHDQKLVREYLRHGAEWTAYVHCQAISRASLMTTDRDITYLRARYSHSVLPDDPDVDDPYFIFIINEFGIGQGWRFRTDMHSAFTFHALPEATSSSQRCNFASPSLYSVSDWPAD